MRVEGQLELSLPICDTEGYIVLYKVISDNLKVSAVYAITYFS